MGTCHRNPFILLAACNFYAGVSNRLHGRFKESFGRVGGRPTGQTPRKTLHCVDTSVSFGCQNGKSFQSLLLTKLTRHEMSEWNGHKGSLYIRQKICIHLHTDSAIFPMCPTCTMQLLEGCCIRSTSWSAPKHHQHHPLQVATHTQWSTRLESELAGHFTQFEHTLEESVAISSGSMDQTEDQQLGIWRWGDTDNRASGRFLLVTMVTGGASDKDRCFCTENFCAAALFGQHDYKFA